MKVTQTAAADGKIRLDVIAPANQMNDVIKAAGYVLAMQNGIEIDPEGKQDMAATVIEKVGEPQYKAFVNNYAMQYLTPFAVSQRNLSIIMAPDTYSEQEAKPGKDFAFRAVVTPKPTYELSSYDPVSVKVPKAEVTEEEIDQQLYNLAQSHTSMEDDEGAEVRDHSDVEFGLETSDDKGEPIPNLTADKRYYTLGENFLPEDFDRNLLGMKAGETREFDFELPGPLMPDGSSEARKVHTKVTLAAVKKRVVPAITDAWVMENMPMATNVPALREMIRQQGEEFKAKELENHKFFAVASALATRFQGKISDEIYEYTRSEMMQNFMAQLQQQNITLQDFLQRSGMEEQQFSMQIMMEVRETLRQSFSLDALARHMGLTVNDEDIIATLKRMAPGQEERAKQEFEGTGRMYMLREAALRTKANQWLYDTATFEYVEPSTYSPPMI
jgi:trigger factor